MSDWKLREAKARLSELIRRAQARPQRITLHGRRAAVVLSEDQYQRLSRPRPRFVEFMRSSPLAGVELEVPRDRSPARRPKLS